MWAWRSTRLPISRRLSFKWKARIRPMPTVIELADRRPIILLFPPWNSPPRRHGRCQNRFPGDRALGPGRESPRVARIASRERYPWPAVVSNRHSALRSAVCRWISSMARTTFRAPAPRTRSCEAPGWVTTKGIPSKSARCNSSMKPLTDRFHKARSGLARLIR